MLKKCRQPPNFSGEISASNEHRDAETDEELSDLERACRSLLATTPDSRPTRLELDLTTFLLGNCGELRSEVVRAVCVAAVNWNRPTLWDKTVKTCWQNNSVHLLQSQGIYDALLRFGLERIRPTYVPLYRC